MASLGRFVVEEPVGVVRTAELVRGGIPLAPGHLRPGAEVAVADDGEILLTQARPLELWRDGSVRWLELCFLADVAPESRRTFELVEAESASASPLRIEAGTEGVVLRTGAETWSLARDPLALRSENGTVVEFHVATVDRRFGAHRADDVEVLDDGPVTARVRASGLHESGAGLEILPFAVEVEVVAGRSETAVAYTIEQRTAAEALELAEWTVTLTQPDAEAARCGHFDAVHETPAPFELRTRNDGYRTGIFVSSAVLADRDEWLDASDPPYEAQWEWAELHGRHGANWLELRGEAKRAAIAVPRFADDAPRALRFEGGSVARFLVWPGPAPLRLRQGWAPTARLSLRARPESEPAQRFAARVDIPLVPVADRGLVHAVVPEAFAVPPDTYPTLEAHIRAELFSWIVSGQAQGFPDRGDGVQGNIGPRAGYLANNEHDALLALCLHYLRSGERAYLDSALSLGDHLVEIDQIHFSTRNGFETGGLRAHGLEHVHYVVARTDDGLVETSVDSAHQWVEGLLLLSAITGRSRYRDAACEVGTCLLRLEQLGWTRPEPGPRNAGWPLIALTALARVGAGEEFRAAARRIAARAVGAQDEDGGWRMRLGFCRSYSSWQNAILLVGFARMLTTDADDELVIRSAFQRGVKALLTSGRFADGTFVFADRFDYRIATHHGVIREALAAAYGFGGDAAVLQAGLAGGERWYRRGPGPVRSNDIADWCGHLPFLAAAHRAGILSDLPAPTRLSAW